jgi:DNA-binding MarR family transcriptional regulator
MTSAPTLTGQDVGEAEGALNALLERILAGTNTGLSRTEYIVLRVLAVHGPAESPAALCDYLAEQPQLGLNRPSAAALLDDLETRGLITGGSSGGPGATQLTPAGAAVNTSLAEAVRTVTMRLYADLDQGDLETAHRVLADVTERARRLRQEL